MEYIEATPSRGDMWIARRQLKKIQRSFGKIDITGAHEPTNTCDGFRLMSRNRQEREIGAFALINGAAIVYTSKNFLSDVSHRFIIPDEGEDIRYRRESFNVDFQAIPSQPLDRQGLDQIVTMSEAYRELYFVKSELSIAAKNGFIIEPPQNTTVFERGYDPYSSRAVA